jgi:HD superfamily phosphohydrolase
MINNRIQNTYLSHMTAKEIITKIVELLQDKEKINYDLEKYAILNFGRSYKIVEEIGGGEQGTVLRIKNPIGKEFALKFYAPDEEEITPSKLKRGLEIFKKEIGITSKLNHKSIVRIITGGYAGWEKNGCSWNIMEGFDGVTLDNLKDGTILFYIMDVITGQSLDEIFISLSEDKNPENFRSVDERLYFFEKLISQVSIAIEYFNSEMVYHTDIKADNIRLSASDNNFVIFDFGFARDLNKAVGMDPDELYLEKKKLKHIKVYPDHESNNLPATENRYRKVDMFQFCSLLLDILKEFVEVYGENRYNGIKSILEKGNGPLAKRYTSMKALYADLRHNFIIKASWKLQYKLDEYMTPPKFGKFYTHIIIPEHTFVFITREIEEIINSVDFRHLLGVKQLGPTLFVFPGAQHTRFEHSLGAYHLSMRYLEKLVPQSEFRKYCDPIEETIKLTALSALLHDVGHYPYSHWIEEINYKFPNGDVIDSHEKRGCNIITNGKIGEIIRKSWGLDIESFDQIMGNNFPLLESKERIIRSIIDSQIDVDKLDYLIRDSIHCGVTYGKSIDVEIILNNLVIDSETTKIGLTSKGRTSFNAIIDARNNLYEGVYWHKTVRACEAMFKRFFFEFLTMSGMKKEEVEILFRLDDSLFLNELFMWALESKERGKLLKLIEPFTHKFERRLYKPVYIHFNNNRHRDEESNTTHFFQRLISMEFNELREKGNALVEALKSTFDGFAEMDDYDILFEKTPLQPYNSVQRLDDFRFWNPRKKSPDNTSDEINRNLRYLSENMQAYLFCNPAYEAQLKMAINDRKFNAILGKI